jgi:hypothetical protein
MKTVLRAPDAKTSVEEQGQALAARILSTANFAARMAFLHQDLPIFRHAFRVLKDAATGRNLFPPLQHEAAVRRVEFNRDETRLLTITYPEIQL